jgi:ABC-type dipeptide/oligopeptide/nickel transport system permease subunit
MTEGASNARILFRHVLPNSIGPLLVAVSMALGGAIAAEATLSYLGIGIQPPNASWGTMIAENVGRLRSVPHLLLIPAAVVALVMLAFNFLGDGINDVLNARQ